jgi:hypothetical protein
MMWFLLAVAAIGTRILIPRLRREPPGTVGSLLVREFGVRGSGPHGERTRIQHLWAALYSLLAAAAGLGLSVGSIGLTDGLPASGTASTVLTGLGFVAMLLSVLALVAAVVSLIKAPLAPRRFDPGPS